MEVAVFKIYAFLVLGESYKYTSICILPSILAKSSFFRNSMSPYMLFSPTSYHFLACNILIRKWHPLFEDCLQCLVRWCQSALLERTPLQRSWWWILSVWNTERRLVWKYMVQSTHAKRFLSLQSTPCLAGSRPQSRQFSRCRTPLKCKISTFFILTSLYCGFHLHKWGLKACKEVKIQSVFHSLKISISSLQLPFKWTTITS